MARFYSRETLGSMGVINPVKIQGNVYDTPLKRIRAIIDYDGQASGDDIVLGQLPVGAVFAYGVLTASATAGASATIAIGTTGTLGKYRAAATFTAANTPTMFGTAAGASMAPLAAPELLLATVGTAALPTSTDYLIVDIYYSDLA